MFITTTPRSFPKELLSRQLSSLNKCMGLPCPRCICWFSSQGLQDLSGLKIREPVHRPFLIYYHQQICRMCILYLCPHICPHCSIRYWTIWAPVPETVSFLPVATCRSRHWLSPFTSSSARDLNPFATTRKAQGSKMTLNATTRSYASNSYLNHKEKRHLENLTVNFSRHPIM